MNQQRSDQPAAGAAREGEGTDGKGSRGMVDEKTRPARPGETDTTRFGMLEEGADSDGSGTGGMTRGEDAGGPIPGAAQSQAGQGTGGGLNSDEDSGTLARRSDGEREEKKP